MLMNLFLFWVLMSLFCGREALSCRRHDSDASTDWPSTGGRGQFLNSRSVGRAMKYVFGVLVFFWAVRLLAGFGLMLLLVILVIAVFSKVIVPFVSTFLRHFQ